MESASWCTISLGDLFHSNLLSCNGIASLKKKKRDSSKVKFLWFFTECKASSNSLFIYVIPRIKSVSGISHVFHIEKQQFNIKNDILGDLIVASKDLR